MKGKVAILKKEEEIEIKEFDVPDPGEGEVLLKVLRANICGSDLHMFKGEAFRAFGGLPYHIVLGHEFVARVEKKGKGVEKDSLGNPVEEGDIVSPVYFKSCGRCVQCSRGEENACMQSLLSVLRNAEKPPFFVGAFAEYYMLRENQKFYKLPHDISIKTSTSINCALSQVIFGLEKIGIEYGDNVVVQGAGGLGLLAVAVAKDMGAQKVIVVDAVEKRLNIAKEFGADEVIKLDGDFRERISRVKEITSGGADVAIELAGTPDAVKEGIKYLRRGGRYLVMGAVNPKQKFDADPSVWIGENLTIKGVSLYQPHIIVKAINFIKRVEKRLPLEKMFYTVRFDEIHSALSLALSKNYPRVQIEMAD